MRGKIFELFGIILEVVVLQILLFIIEALTGGRRNDSTGNSKTE